MSDGSIAVIREPGSSSPLFRISPSSRSRRSWSSPASVDTRSNFSDSPVKQVELLKVWPSRSQYDLSVDYSNATIRAEAAPAEPRLVNSFVKMHMKRHSYLPCSAPHRRRVDPSEQEQPLPVAPSVFLAKASSAATLAASPPWPKPSAPLNETTNAAHLSLVLGHQMGRVSRGTSGKGRTTERSLHPASRPPVQWRSQGQWRVGVSGNSSRSLGRAAGYGEAPAPQNTATIPRRCGPRSKQYWHHDYLDTHSIFK